MVAPVAPAERRTPNALLLGSEKAQVVQPFLKIHFNWRRRRTSQKVDKLHRACIDRNSLWMRELVIDDPFGPVRKLICHKDVAAVGGRVPDVPTIENQPAVNAVGGQSGRQGNGIIHALALLSFAFECRITSDSVVQGSAERESAEDQARQDTGDSDKKAFEHRRFCKACWSIYCAKFLRI